MQPKFFTRHVWFVFLLIVFYLVVPTSNLSAATPERFNFFGNPPVSDCFSPTCTSEGGTAIPLESTRELTSTDIALPANKVPPIPAFPGAEGFGATTPGGRGGRVIEVTNLNDRGPGSLRACAEAEGPRICVFRVAGTIEVQSRINIWDPYITIAGQTAPGGGITLKLAPGNLKAPLAILTHDVIIRYLRSRPGPSSAPSSNIDAITIVHEVDEDHPDEGVYNIIIDHSSFSWGTDEVVNLWYDVHDITIQWSIIAEGLDCSNHSEEACHSKGMLVGSDGAHNITLHHNLFAHNAGRNPNLDTGNGIVDMVNNILYVPGNIAANTIDNYGQPRLNLVGNYLLSGPNSEEDILYMIQHLGNQGASIYVKGNIDYHRTQNSQPESFVVAPGSRQYITNARHPALPVTTTSAFKALDQVLAGVGAIYGLNSKGQFFWRRDTADTRVVNETRTGTGGLVDDPSEVGGWPQLSAGTPYVDNDHDGMADAWEILHNLNPNVASDNKQDRDQDGYTNIEEFLNGTHPGVSPGPGPNPNPEHSVFIPFILKP